MIRNNTPLKTISLSIVIPFFNDNESIRDCLKSIERAMEHLPVNAEKPEVIVVDDHSPAPFERGETTVPVCCHRFPENRGVGAARNMGARLARGTHILFLDSDVMLAEDHLARLLDLLSTESAPIIQGLTSRRPPNNPAGLFHHYMALSWNYYQMYNWKISIFTQCFAVEKTFFYNLGGFSEHYERSGGEEFELGLRLARKGSGFIAFDPNLIHFHHSENLIKRLKKVYLRSHHIRQIALSMPNLPFRFTAQSLMRSAFALILNLALLMCLVKPGPGVGLYVGLALLYYITDDGFSRHIRKHHSLFLALLSVVYRQLEYTFINLGMLRALFMRDVHDRSI